MESQAGLGRYAIEGGKAGKGGKDGKDGKDGKVKSSGRRLAL